MGGILRPIYELGNVFLKRVLKGEAARKLNDEAINRKLGWVKPEEPRPDYLQPLSNDRAAIKANAEDEHKKWLAELAKKTRNQERWYEQGLPSDGD